MATEAHHERAPSAPGSPPTDPSPRTAIAPDSDPVGLGPPGPGSVAALDRLRSLVPRSWHDAVPGGASAGLGVRAGPLLVLVLALGAALALAGLLATRSVGPAVPEPDLADPGFATGTVPFGSARAVGTGGATGGGGGRDPATTAAAVVQVHAAGAVVAPGVHRLPAGARVADLVAAAGGLTPDADVDRVNLAAVLVDGSRVYVPRRGESSVPNVPAEVGAGGGAGPSTPKGPVDLNTATVEELDTLPGVGPTTAQAIIDHRTRNGPFRSVDDLAKVRGIGPAKLAELRPLVTV